jgi:AcrR family transcriptional regulator
MSATTVVAPSLGGPAGPGDVGEVLPGHRERKKLATRSAIQAAAFDLVEASGLSHATVEAISERAGVAPRTFWAYFNSKEDAVVGRDPASADRLRSALLARPADEDPLFSLRVVLGDFVQDRVVDSAMAVRRQRLIRREPQLMAVVAAIYDEMERALVSAVAERLGVDSAADIRPAVFVMAACGACRVAQIRWADLGGEKDFGALVDEAFEVLTRGLAPATRGEEEEKSADDHD